MYSYDRRASASKTASVIDSLLILAKDHGAKTIKYMSGFKAKFPDKKKVDSFLRDAHMEYPGIGRKIQQRKAKNGDGIELLLSPRDAEKFEPKED